MEARTLVSALLNCGYAEVDYLIGLMEAHGFDGWDLVLDLEYLGDSQPTINDFIGAAFDRVAQDLLEHVVKRRSSRFVTTLYEIYVNSIASELCFDDPNLNRWYEVWRRG